MTSVTQYMLTTVFWTQKRMSAGKSRPLTPTEITGKKSSVKTALQSTFI